MWSKPGMLMPATSASIVLAVWDKQPVGLLYCEFGRFLLNTIKDMTRNVNVSFAIFIIQHVKSWDMHFQLELSTMGWKYLSMWRSQETTYSHIFTRIFMNEKFCILIRILLKFVAEGPTDNKSALVQVMAWCRTGDKPLSEPLMVSLLTHICITWPPWI